MIDEVDDPPKHEAVLERIADVPVAATAAHVYTECARIWNPIHTDRAYARAAGLPGIILHGTATLALSVSKLLEVLKHKVRRVRCRFAGMVLMPSTLTVHGSPRARRSRSRPAMKKTRPSSSGADWAKLGRSSP